MQTPRALRLVPWALMAAATLASGQRILRTTSLDTCQETSSLAASQFDIRFTPNNNTVHAEISVISSVAANVTFDVTLFIYGYPALRQTVDPCDMDLLCPLMAARIHPDPFNIKLDDGVTSMIPAIGYTFPDIDAGIEVIVNRTDTGETIACLETKFSNTKTVDLKAIKWATALVTILGVATSAVMSALGHTNTAAHLASSTLSLFAYFQAQAMVGLSGVRLPPAAQAWTQNFLWSLGMIEISWMQSALTWYQRATGGTPATLLHEMYNTSVHVMKRGLDTKLGALAKRAFDSTVGALAKRANIQLDSGAYVVYGIQRAGFQNDVESTNIFMTVITFYVVLMILAVICVGIFQLALVLAAKKRWLRDDHFVDFRHSGWQPALKGILLRITFVCFPAIAIFCLWELTQIDSAAIAAVAVIFLLGSLLVLGLATFKIIRIARSSMALHHTPSYLLFSDPSILQRWGFLYISFRASAYYYVAPMLGYYFIKAIIIALVQHHGTAQAVCLILIEVTALASATLLRPWMDKSTNALNISICVVNFINAILIFLLANVFSAPRLLVGISGILIFLFNAIFSLGLLILVIGSSVVVFWRKNPDNRYRAMADDRASFWRSKTQVNTTQELDDLAATARGGKGDYYGDGGLNSPMYPSDTSRFSPAASKSQLSLRDGR